MSGHGLQNYDDMVKIPRLVRMPGVEVDPELLEVRKLIAFWITKGTGRVEPVEEMDPAIEAKLKAIGYF